MLYMYILYTILTKVNHIYFLIAQTETNMLSPIVVLNLGIIYNNCSKHEKTQLTELRHQYRYSHNKQFKKIKARYFNINLIIQVTS